MKLQTCHEPDKSWLTKDVDFPYFSPSSAVVIMKDLSLSLLSRGCGRSVSSSNRSTGRREGRLDVCFTPEDYYIWQSKETLLRLSSSGHLFAEAESSLPKTYSTRRGALLLYSQDLVAVETNSGLETGYRKKRIVPRETQQVQQHLKKVKELTSAVLSFSNNQVDKDEEQDNRKRVRLDLFLQMPSTSRTKTPQAEPQPWVHYVAITPKEPEKPQTYIDDSPQLSGSSQPTETSVHSARGEIHHPNMRSFHDAADGQGCFFQDSGIGGLLPRPLDSSVSHRACWEKKDRPRRESPSRDLHQNTATLHHRPLVLPPLFPDKEEVKEKQTGGREQTKRRHLKRNSVEQRGGGGGTGGHPSEKGSVILLQPEEEPPPPPVGGMGGVVGWKGPGKQSSLAFLHHLHDPCESSETNRGVVRGVLPLELRDFQNRKPVGSLIVGPDGDIIQLSLYDSSQGPSQGDGCTEQKALQVLSSEGEELPWVIVLQPEHTNTEGGVELNTRASVDDTQHRQSVQKGAEGHVPVGQVAAEELHFSTKQVSYSTDVSTKKKRKSSKRGTETWKEHTKDAKNKVRMPPLRERVAKGKMRGGNTEEEEEEEEEEENEEEDEDEEQNGEEEDDYEDEDEDLGSTGHSSYLYGSNRSGEIFSPTDPTMRHTVDKKKKNAKRRATEEAAITAGKRAVKSKEPDGHNTVRKTEKRQKPRIDDAQSIRTETDEEEETTGEAAGTQDQSALPSVMKKKKNKIKDREGRRGEMNMNEDREDPRGGNTGQKEASSRRKRRGRRKEILAGSPEDPMEDEEEEEEESDPEMQNETQRKSTQRASAAQKHSDDTTTEDDTDTDCVSTNDQYSSVRSVSSHRSTVASSHFNARSSRRSVASSYEGGVSASVVGPAASRGRMSSCSTVMITEEQLMLNPKKPEFSGPTKSQGEEEAALLHRAQRAERRRLQDERKRREQEEQERKMQQREQTQERMKKEERRRREEQEQERARLEQAQRERERRRQEERRRQMEQLRRLREVEEQRRKDKLELLRLEEEKQQEEERRMLEEMDESERIEYLCRKKQEQEERRLKEEEQRKRDEEAAVEARLQAELLNRQVALLQQQLSFKRGLVLEAGGLEKTQGISRPWIYSYFALLQLLGPSACKAETVTP
ncbi:hypothetical protein Q5P01_013982 [Channa striata]|uniref:Uncharacterized protein n=1 Tax=Channa striata TaxID=64152 RepID=A0AA88MKC1_CHASR|nr:hypothetical protein Q5P01_013982 [Channa striata]